MWLGDGTFPIRHWILDDTTSELHNTLRQSSGYSRLLYLPLSDHRLRIQVAALASGEQRLRSSIQQEIEAGGLRAAPLVQRIRQVLAEGGSSPVRPTVAAAPAPPPLATLAAFSPAAPPPSGEVGTADGKRESTPSNCRGTLHPVAQSVNPG